MDQRDILLRLVSTAGRILAEFPSPPCQSSKATECEIPPLRLAPPTSRFQANLLRHDFPPRIRQLALSKAEELALSYQRSYEGVCRDMCKIPCSQRDTSLADVVRNLRGTYETLFETRDLPRFLQDVVAAQASRSASTSKVVDERKVFNHEYTPVLEKYFQCNAYPSLQVRALLASSTRMSPRQIEVWFQNHRNRARRDQRPVKRLMHGDPLALALNILKNMPTTQSKGCQAVDDDDESDITDDEFSEEISVPREYPREEFSAPRPPHAFPIPFRSRCSQDPFPTINGVFKFPSPIWQRRPASSLVRADAISVDELIVMFAAKLNLRENATKKISDRKLGSPLPSRTPWFYATTIIPSPAPLPALIRPPSPVSQSMPSSSPHSRQSSVCPSRSHNHKPSKPRKVAAFPKRVPQEGFSPYSRTPSSDFGSRTSSLSSISSSHSRNTSSSGSSSTRPMTPPMSFAPLQTNVPCSEDNFHIFQQLFGFDEPSQRKQSPLEDSLSKLGQGVGSNIFDFSSMFPLTASSYITAQS